MTPEPPLFTKVWQLTQLVGLESGSGLLTTERLSYSDRRYIEGIKSFANPGSQVEAMSPAQRETVERIWRRYFNGGRTA